MSKTKVVGVWEGAVKVDEVRVPNTIGHGYSPVEARPLSAIYSMSAHKRIGVFTSKGLKCATPGCDRQAYHFIKGIDKNGSNHWDLYTKDFVLMTVDHIHPKSKGGTRALHNMQPMCEPCNTKKGAKLPNELLSSVTNKHYVQRTDGVGCHSVNNTNTRVSDISTNVPSGCRALLVIQSQEDKTYAHWPSARFGSELGKPGS